ncbi:MAG: peptidylprolyl isomerase [Spirochaetota bacterium]
MKKYFFLILAAFLFITACGNKQAAIVNGIIIYENEVLEGIKDMSPETIERLGKENVKQNILDGLVERQLLLCKIKEENYGKSEKIQKLWIPYKKEITIKYFLNTYLPDTKPLSGSLIKDEYNKKKEMFKIEGQVHVRHILIRTGNGYHSEQEALNKITSIAGELKKNGSNFAELAKKYSECPSKEQGGDLSFITRGQMVKPFEDAAFALKKGEVTGKPVKTVYGYHLIYAEDVKPASYTPLAEVKKYIMPGIYIAEMEKEYGLTIYPEKDKDANIGEIKKLNYKYNQKSFRDDLEMLIGKAEASNYTRNNQEIMKAAKELMYLKIFEDKMKNINMEKSENYQKYFNKAYDEFLSSNYVENVVFKDVTVTDAEVRQIYRTSISSEMLVRQYGPKFGSDASYRRQLESEVILPGIKRQLIDQKKTDLYTGTIDELKKKYPVEIKIKYKTT